MNELIKKQLLACEHVVLPTWDDNTTLITIKKGSIKKELKFEFGCYYKIEISDKVLSPTSESTLAKNWNGNTVPPSKIFNCVVQQLMGKMVKVDGVAVIDNVATDQKWNGWLPISEVVILEEI
uniref:Uncharacterized protein n=1 Tax=Siphoviridae sp. ctrpg19 TaxID=2826481 RepID=A0A8S5MLC8_9CAUD|nr:MAG TPA: hypothetical protein [Siphoviridae sp. ctrpg19]